jgi:hypothetical protein
VEAPLQQPCFIRSRSHAVRFLLPAFTLLAALCLSLPLSAQSDSQGSSSNQGTSTSKGKKAAPLQDSFGTGSQPGSQSFDLSNSSGSDNSDNSVKNALPPPPSAIDPAGPAVSLESNESLFDLAAALNTCGYDDGLADSASVRSIIRAEILQAIADSPDAPAVRDQMCRFIQRHDPGDPSQNVSQYISLAVYLSPPPDLTPSVEPGQMPPDSIGVEGVLPYVRHFASLIDLHLIWMRHRPDYEDLINSIHDPMTKMILETNIYLKEPTSIYQGHRFLVLLEPMLSPGLTNARVYGTDYIVVTSPMHINKDGVDSYTVRLDQIRHTYLHYQIEPLIYTHAGALERMVGFLAIVREAPMDFSFRSDIVAFFTECMIHAIETRNMDVGIALPPKPAAGSPRYEFDTYATNMDTWEREAEVVRRRAVDDYMHQGFVLTDYFYNAMILFEHDPGSLDENIGSIVYGMDVGREENAAKHVTFYAQGSEELVQHVHRQLHGLDLADLKMVQGDTEGAADIAQNLLDSKDADGNPIAKPSDADAARANFILGRVDILDKQTEDAINCFHEVLRLSQDARTLAWSHIYLGRIYDINSTQNTDLRLQALNEYREALKVHDDLPDTKEAAESGLKQPFTLPQTAANHRSDNDKDDDDNTPLDPSGKAEKESYKPDAPDTTTPSK